MCLRLLYVILLSGLGLNGQSLLWEVSKADQPRSYVYGTIHIQEKEVFAYDTIVEQKLKSCDQFMPELVLDEINPAAMMQKLLLPDSLSLTDIMSEKQYSKLDSICKVKMGVGLMPFNKMKPFFISVQLMEVDMKKDMPVALDLYLTQLARNAGLRVEGLETMEEQLAAIDQISVEDQVKMLFDGLEDQEEWQMEELKEAYLKGDLKGLMELTDDPSLPDEFDEAFLTVRNNRMADRIDSISVKQAVFYAVGAAHLGGDNGVLNLLKHKGFEVKPIPFTFNQN